MHKLGYDTTLAWDAAPGASRYDVVWRATDAPAWQHAKDVGNLTQVTLPVSKDDYVFGVRSVDSAGHQSFASYPAPVRQ